MTDKEKIRQEIETVSSRRLNRLRGEWFELEEETEGMVNELLSLIFSAPQEPVNDDLEEVTKQYAKDCVALNFPSSDGKLKESDIKAAVRYGAYWKERQMMKDAVEGTATLDYYDAKDRAVMTVFADEVIAEEHGIKEGDKVKIIIIKE